MALLRVACRVCERQGVNSVARLAERYGAEIALEGLLPLLTASCKWQLPPQARTPRRYQPRCLAHSPDLIEPEPDSPARRLRVVPGGRA